MYDLNKTFIYKDGRYSSDALIVLKELENHYIVRRVDTGNDDTQIISVSKDYVNKYMYTAAEFLKTSQYIGKSVYNPSMPGFMIELFQSLILVYKNDYNELYYDTILNSFFIASPIFDEDDMYISPEQPNIQFKDWFGIR